jgi:hypothetical protein
MRSEDQFLSNKSTRRSRGLLFDNNWSSDRIIYGCFEFISKKFADIKILHEGYTADYFLNRMKTNALFPILFIQNNLFKKKSGTTFFIRLLHSVHFREILSGYFLFSRFDWSIFVTQLVARHMKEIIYTKFSALITLMEMWSRKIVN